MLFLSASLTTEVADDKLQYSLKGFHSKINGIDSSEIKVIFGLQRVSCRGVHDCFEG